MLSGRMCSVSFSGVAITATQALITVYASASKIVSLRSITLGQATQTTQGNLRIRLVYFPATVTAGSGGGAGTVGAWNPGDSTGVGSTARINDTTPPTSSGTAVNLWDDTWNLINGFIWVPPMMVEPPACSLSEALSVILDTAPGSSITCNGTLVFEEVT